MWNCVSCETWTAYKMKAKNLISKVVPVLKKDGVWVRNPLVITEDYVRDGELVYGELKQGAEAQAGKELLAQCTTDFARLDQAVQEIVWRFANLFPHCLQMSIDSVRAKKKFFWDQAKLPNRHWLAANMMGEAFLGFHAFSTKKLTGVDTVDFLQYRQLTAQGALMDDRAFEQVLGKPKG